VVSGVLLHSFLNAVLDGGVCVVNVTAQPPYPRKTSRYQLNGKLDVLGKRNICASAGIRTPDLPSANLASELTTLCWLLCVFKLFMLRRCGICLGKKLQDFNCNFADLLRREMMMLTGSGIGPWALQKEPLAVKRRPAVMATWWRTTWPLATERSLSLTCRQSTLTCRVSFQVSILLWTAP
jgi:hypothetical protein